jgi:electron transfer flavoprotein alpha subunit
MAHNVVIVALAFGPADRALQGLAGAAQALAGTAGGRATAVVLGPAGDAVAAQLAPVVHAVRVLRNPALAEYQPEPFLALIAAACRDLQADIVLLGGDTYSQEITPRLAHRLGGVAAADAVGLEVADGAVLVRRAVYGGKAEAVFRLNQAPAVAWIRARAFAPATALAASAAIELVDVEPPPGLPTRIVERSTESAGAVRLEDAARIVSGGRGVGGAEAFDLLRDLAGVLGAQLAATRAPCDAGWVPSSWQVGQTGKKVAPDLYLAIALSGSSQHLLGISDAKVIATINIDPDAPIFRHSRFGLVEDFRAAVPLLSKVLASSRQ